MKTYKWATPANEVVMQFDEDGLCRTSGLRSAFPDGIVIEPADPAPEPAPVDPVEKLRAFLAANPDVQAIL